MKTPLTLVSTFIGATLATSLLAAPSQAAPVAETPTTTKVSATKAKTAAEKKAAKKAAALKAKKKKAAAIAKKKKIAKIRKARAIKTRAVRALKVARTKKGARYVYGATGPSAFDCSGLTSWSYKKVGKNLPRTAAAQAKAAKRTKNPRLGDLVFFYSGSRVYHVGLYAGKGYVFHASRPGKPVKTEKIWTNKVFYGRAA
ncbi:C40 family peptidase [Nocardioides yefusunii]|uniref:C40 family peptidase n=1 Tax=Nocardioides yefusunii TaxID=2500546 RepID=A0ABW1QUB9_9ACTN|nr:C40 family peptidase [Nocardioides yefusunii]